MIANPATAPDTPDVTNDPRANGRKITAVLAAESGYADLYRTAVAGPRGQRARLHVARVWYRAYGVDEFTIVDPRSGSTVGRAGRVVADGAWWWSITAECPYTGDLQWLGYAETLSAGADWCVNGLYTARGRHDSQRVSQVAIRTADQVHAARAREHTAACAPCRDAGQTNGFIDCVTR